MSELLLIVRRSWAKHGNASSVAADLGVSTEVIWAIMNEIDAIENSGF